jgi:hypothetical protein
MFNSNDVSSTKKVRQIHPQRLGVLKLSFKQFATDVCIHPAHNVNTTKNCELWRFVLHSFNMCYHNTVIYGQQFYVF